MNVDTDKMVDILKKDQPISVIMVDDHGKDKLICLFALPHLADKVTEFVNGILKEEQ